ncbi:hypothetical protein [Tolypothrix sp. PCC 7601]
MTKKKITIPAKAVPAFSALRSSAQQ